MQENTVVQNNIKNKFVFNFTELIQLITCLGVVLKKFFCQKSELSDSAETPPLAKSDTLFKNIFIAFLNSTAFVCYLEINLFFSHLKIRRKT